MNTFGTHLADFTKNTTSTVQTHKNRGIGAQRARGTKENHPRHTGKTPEGTEFSKPPKFIFCIFGTFFAAGGDQSGPAGASQIPMCREMEIDRQVVRARWHANGDPKTLQSDRSTSLSALVGCSIDVWIFLLSSKNAKNP